MLLALACAGLYAQANSELTGIVTDQTGAVVPGAKLTLTDPATGNTKTAESGATGLYDFNGLNPANYNLKVSAKAFEAFQQNGIVVNVSATVRQDIKLTVGAESQTVTVEADALTVQTDSNVVSTLISSEQISEIATENRNFAALAALGLGVSSALPDSNTPTSVASNFALSINGLRSSHNIWLIDGGEADDRGGAGGMDIMPSQDAIAEFNVLASNYPPDYGISSGATMSLSLKSGTQKFHGEAWEFNRNTDYNANSFFDKLSTPATQRAATHYNIFGYNVGGPLYIPHVYNTSKQKTFFFYNEEWRKILSSAGTNEQNTIDPADYPKAGQNLTYVVPKFAPNTQLVVPNISTNSSYWQTKIAPLGPQYQPNQPWPGGYVPASLFDSNGITYLNSGIFPAVNVPAQDKNITAASNPISVLDTVLRIDHKFNDKWAILGHYMDDQVTQGYAAPELGWLWASYNTLTSTLSNPSQSAAIKLSGTINSNLLVEASINYDGNVLNIIPSANTFYPSSWNVTPVASAFTITRKVYPGLGDLGPYGVAEDTGSAPWHNAARDYEPKIDISYTMGKHAMKYGFSYNRYDKNQEIFGDSQGIYNPSSTTNDGAMDLLLGLTSSYTQENWSPIRHWVNQTPSAYVEDNWHLTPRFSLQLGIRYDALPHAWERDNAQANFDPTYYNPSELPIWTAAGTIDPSSPSVATFSSNWAAPLPFYLNGIRAAGVEGTPRGEVENKYNTWQPRIGFSEDLFGNGKTVLRGGFGTFFERTQGNDVYNAAPNAPFVYVLNTNNTYLSAPGVNWSTGVNAAAQGFPISVTNPIGLAVNNYNPPAVAMYSIGVQHEITPSVVGVVQYVGNVAWHQWAFTYINDMPLSVIGQTATIPNQWGGAGTVTAPLTCLAGDSGVHVDGNKGQASVDANCKNGFGALTSGGAAIWPAGLNQFRTYQGYTTIKDQVMNTNGTYNGFEAGVRIQNRWGFSGELDYTYSHEIDIQSVDDVCCVSNPWNLKYDKGSGVLDRRQMVNANYIYKLPFFAKTSGLIHSIAGGWEIAGTLIDESGLPNSQVTGAGGVPNNSGNGYDSVGMGGDYTVRPNVSGKMSYPKKMGQWFDTSKFSSVTPQWLGGANLGFGTAGKDAVVGPGRVNFTTSLYKSFAVTERAHFELRFESFNTFNHTEPYGLATGFNPQNNYPFSTAVGSGQFGAVTSTWDPRNLELGGKFVF
jgi:hypothetical protein